MSKGRKKHAEEHEEHGPDERWMASYMDMVTVLMCMFIVLFAMSTVDAKKFDLLRNSLATGFGQTDIGKLDTAKGTIIDPTKASKTGENFGAGPQTAAATAAAAAKAAATAAAIAEVDKIKDLQAKVSASLAVQGLQGTVQYTIDQRGLTIRLVDQQAFFAPNSTVLQGSAPQVLDDIARVLSPTGQDIAVEGHADSRATLPPFPTNWELSSGRAVSVLRRMVESGGVPAAKIGAVGYGSSRPIALGTTLADYAQNRRVDIIALSNASESVRALIPDVVSGKIPGGPPADAPVVTAAASPASWIPVVTNSVPLILLPAGTSGR
ncbi:flagellar motor protein MotB [Lacisediminihabitans sp. H27-G8]|uniref:OmpA/MotB family protein n=1 Tax=Lacisediminihabitans sp. H27-G8 TaxID=3111909 RepID=UPI0038FC1627